MPSTHLSLHYHFVFSTKNREPWLAPTARIAISKTDFRIAEQKVLYKTGGSALRMVVESARTQT
jgi:hypothetical protein